MAAIIERPIWKNPDFNVISIKEAIPVEIKKFSQESLDALKEHGFAVYVLKRQSIKSKRAQGRKFWNLWHENHPDFESLSSMYSEVAINPRKLLLTDSNNKSQRQQEELIAKFSGRLGNEIQGVEAIMGEAADYVDLAFTHLEKKHTYLFGEKYNYVFTRTQTPTIDGSVANVGCFHKTNGLRVTSTNPNYGDPYIFAVPLIVPKPKKI